MVDWMEKSLEYERLYSQTVIRIYKLKGAGGDAEKKRLRQLANTYRKLSDDAFLQHKATTDVCDDGIRNLANAVLEQAIHDYEVALCDNNSSEIYRIEMFMYGDGRNFTMLDTGELIDKVKVSHKRFKTKAHDEFDEILVTTVQLRDRGIWFGDRRNKHRCPLCGGGMFVKKKVSNGRYIVGCTTCELVEYVERGGKPGAS